ncbi:heme lyase CcmF/NrfE family subunit [Thermaurantiacus sp.]
MIPSFAELGHLALWLAAAAALVMAVAPLRPALAGLARPAAVGHGLLLLLAYAAMTHAFLVSDFSVALVASNSHTAKPLLYKLTGVWANHEGSMLLWVLILAIAGLAVAGARLPLGATFQARALGSLGIVALGFLAFLLFASNPFARLDPAPPEGMGLNPLLQDPGLAFHPPTLYVGYVGLVVAFAMAVAALLDGKVGPQWAKVTRPWVTLAWGFLTMGIALGSWWAYYELGWGGWWFWDPVENAALMPWLTATALLHSIRVLETRDALRNWTLMLAIAGFTFSMLGTFIVRSGLLTSVHAFAVDPTRGLFLLLLLLSLTGWALLVWALRAPRVAEGARFAMTSREGFLVGNNLLLMALLAIVFIGTLYPLALEAWNGRQISVGPPYFNATTVPLILALAALMAVGPFLAWKRGTTRSLGRRLLPAAIAATAAALLMLALFGVAGVFALLGFAAAAWLGVASLQLLLRRGLTFGRAGTALAHLGVALTILGASASGALQREALVSIPVGDGFEVAGFAVTLEDVAPKAGPNWTALEARLAVRRAGELIATLQPQARTYTSPPMETTEAGIAMWRMGDLYAVLGKPDGSGRWQIHFWWKPLIHLLWWGAALMAVGAVVALGGALRFAALARRRPAAAPAPGVPLPAE